MVKKIGEALMGRGIAPWLYSWDVQPGMPEQREIERQIKYIQAAAVFSVKQVPVLGKC